MTQISARYIEVILAQPLSDLPRLLKLDRLFWTERQELMAPAYRHIEEPMPEESMRERISNDQFQTFLAEVKGKIVGYLVAKVRMVPLAENRSEKEGRICDVFVLSSHRRKGTGSKLYAAACEWFDEEECDCEGLTVHSANPALSLHQGWGFAPFSLNMWKRRSAAKQDAAVGFPRCAPKNH